jgi:hypothetical protein
MLARNLFGFFGLGSLLTIGMLGGCIITTATGSGGSGGGTSSGQGGEPTGTGGENVGGSTTGTGGMGTGGSGGNGGADCVGVEGPHTVVDCDNMNITPKTHGGGAAVACGDNLDQEPPGYLVCVHAFTIFTTGAASDLQDCLALIGVEDQCTDSKWQACIDAMYADVCASQDIANACADIANACGADPFDTTQCANDLNPFSNKGLTLFQDCFNGLPNEPCQSAYDTCVTEVLTAPQ